MTLRLENLNQVGPACRALNAEKLGTTMPATGATRAVQGRSGGGTAAGPSEPAPTTGPPSFTLPYPPAALSPNSRSATWHKKAAAAWVVVR